MEKMLLCLSTRLVVRERTVSNTVKCLFLTEVKETFNNKKTTSGKHKYIIWLHIGIVNRFLAILHKHVARKYK